MTHRLQLTALLIAILTLISPLSGMAQKQFTLEQLNYGGKEYWKYTPERRYYTWWGDQLVRLQTDKCSLVDTKTGKEKTLFTLDQLNQWRQDNGEDPVRSLFRASFPYADKTLVMVQSKNKRMLIDFKKHHVQWQQTAQKQQHADFNNTSRNTAYVENDQLYIIDSNDSVYQLSTDGSRDIVYGQSVHRNEFGIMKGTFWSPDGQMLAFYRMDQSMVADYPQVDISQRIAQYMPDKYPMAGETSHEVTVGVYNMTTGKTLYLDCGNPKDRYFTNIQWAPDGKKIYIFELNRDQNDCRLCVYDALTGNKQGEIYRETSPKYVEPMHPIEFLPWDDTKFLMQSQKDGYNHLYLFAADGTLLKQLTSGTFVDISVLGFNQKAKSIIVSSNAESPLQQNIYSIDVASNKRTLIDNGQGWHNGQLSQSGQYVLDTNTAPTVPRCIDLLSTTRKKIVNLMTAADPWQEFTVPEYSVGTIKAADGLTDLYFRMVKPIGFDPNKQYPTVVYVYGGPHAHNVDATWHYGSRSWETYMAQKGFLLFILDNRGSEHRGLDFEQATFRQLGQIEMADQMEGIKYLQSLPYVDADRIGVHGWSFGGFMTMTLMLNHPEVFKVGVAGGPVIDWKYYEVMYGERYMDTPQTNADGYEKTSLLNKAKDLKGHLQIISGYNDNTVVPQNCLEFLSRAIEAGTQPDFFVYPGELHNMAGHSSVHLHERITQYFETFLK